MASMASQHYEPERPAPQLVFNAVTLQKESSVTYVWSDYSQSGKAAMLVEHRDSLVNTVGWPVIL